MTAASLMERTLALASQGYPVFPLTGKVPLPGSRGFKDASRDSRVIQSMPWHLANTVGIACGGDDARLLVLDLDTDKSGVTPLGQSLVLARLNLLPLTTNTRRVRTPGGGVHLYIRVAPDGLPLPTSRTDVLATKGKDGVARCAMCWRICCGLPAPPML
jgi:Bifunctional DNA primase/polymerase, N-terminal